MVRPPTLSLFCTSTLCPIIVTRGSTRVLVYSNFRHMTWQYAEFIAKALGGALTPILAKY